MDADPTDLESTLDPAAEPTTDPAAEPTTEPTADQAAGSQVKASAPLDLDGIQRDLADVEVALARLDAGTYWTDEVTGHQLPADLLAQSPTTRRALAE